MIHLRPLVRWLYLPMMLVGINGIALMSLAGGARFVFLPPLLLAAIALSFGAERIAPYQRDWNRSQGDLGRDVIHAVVNEGLNVLSVSSIPLIALALGSGALWPRHWSFALQVIFALFILDFGVTMAHYASHRFEWLWRFHAVHHSIKRLYGLNGLMKHPLHQGVEMLAGTAPLVFLGMPLEVGIAIAFCTATQLLVQHANVDLQTGPLRRILAVATVHRFHHQGSPALGDVNFGLFTTIWDHLLGTFHYEERTSPFSSIDMGIDAEPNYPVHYLDQLRRPFLPATSVGPSAPVRSDSTS